ncbi:hypothetical protein [Mycobacterium sp.]|uniref:hypothetical protein n=1 Tax=Mycobacterium sp. TaxID=1785 RepID=UPI00121B0EBE|nr:hypothetical protein [Mycobacterium sp.]TAM66390.1 MAG: hypothetical protein EPN51_16600 [Mycobacterium sp.]
MNSPKWTVHWPQRRPTATIYQLTDRLHQGHVARVPAHQITATVSGWLADLGADSPLVDELERAVCGGDWAAAHALGDCLSIEIAVAD